MYRKSQEWESYSLNLLVVSGLTEILSFPILNKLLNFTPPPKTKLISFPLLQYIEVNILPEKTFGASVSYC